MDLQNRLNELKERYQSIAKQFDQDKIHGEIRELEAQMNKPTFWGDPENARYVSQDLSQKQKFLDTLVNLGSKINDAIELSSDESIHNDIEKEAGEIEKNLDDLELHLFLSGPHDSSDAILAIHSGTGGVEAMDWTAMLARMYQRYFEKMDWKVEVSDESFGEEAGYKSITMIVHAPYSYGYLKKEAGTHRLVRQSPFNADKLRQTSFALVEVVPEIAEAEADYQKRMKELNALQFNTEQKARARQTKMRLVWGVIALGVVTLAVKIFSIGAGLFVLGIFAVIFYALKDK